MKEFLIVLLAIGLVCVGIGTLRLSAKIKELDKKIETYKNKGYVSMPYWVDPSHDVGDLIVAGASLINQNPNRYLVVYAKADEVNSFIGDLRTKYMTILEEQNEARTGLGG
ncbi:MAG TPA: hypothetical protein ENH82_09965 [bacterium]|nr:hypothetical protein [bacterium]